MNSFETIIWDNGAVVIIDQRQLPSKEVYLRLTDVPQVIHAIKTLAVRGAPAIGVAGALGVALGAQQISLTTLPAFVQAFDEICDQLVAARPTAVNLAWAVNQVRAVADRAVEGTAIPELKEKLLACALQIRADDIASCKRIGQVGASLICEGDTILTHCNAGALATAGMGTALAVIYAAHDQGKHVRVFADETRPLLQGARLTAWELSKRGVPVTVITDNMAASMMGAGLVQKVIVGADRIAANGDTANKIGTYGVAISAHYHRIPFYIAAPLSTLDPETPTGAQIVIEERASREVSHLFDSTLTPTDAGIRNPAFDVTPAELITGIITDHGILSPPFGDAIHKLFAGATQKS